MAAVSVVASLEEVVLGEEVALGDLVLARASLRSASISARSSGSRSSGKGLVFLAAGFFAVEGDCEGDLEVD